MSNTKSMKFCDKDGKEEDLNFFKSLKIVSEILQTEKGEKNGDQRGRESVKCVGERDREKRVKESSKDRNNGVIVVVVVHKQQNMGRGQPAKGKKKRKVFFLPERIWLARSYVLL